MRAIGDWLLAHDLVALAGALVGALFGAALLACVWFGTKR